jgi:hypothetical protein
MQQPTPKPHPGPFRFMKVDAEMTGVLIALGFTILGFVSMPIAAWFIVGAILAGSAIALLFRFFRKKKDLDPLASLHAED